MSLSPSHKDYHLWHETWRTCRLVILYLTDRLSHHVLVYQAMYTAKCICMRKAPILYKLCVQKLYFHYLIPAKTPSNYPLRNVKEIPIIHVKKIFLENSFSSVTITEWSDFDYSLCNASSITVFKQNILKFIQTRSYLSFQILQLTFTTDLRWLAWLI